MQKKFILLSLLAVFFSIPAHAAYRTKITLIINNGAPVEAVKVSEDLIADDGTYSGTSEALITTIDLYGNSITKTVTTFRNIEGNLMLSADVAITASSTNFTAKAGETFNEVLSVDVKLELYDADYNEYIYSLDVDGLDEQKWLKVSGNVSSYDVIEPGATEYHHEFVIEGTTEISYDVTRIVFTALINISGDYPVLLVIGSKDINISAEVVPKPPDIPTPAPPNEPAPDPPQNVQEYVDTGGGGTRVMTLNDVLKDMTPEQKAAVTTLKINGNITDLDGLSELINLKHLDLTEAVKLESIDLQGNTSITSVDITGNASIVSVNVKDCVNLEELYCSDCSIEELLLDGCNSLRELYCDNNSICKLDLYMLNNLVELDCSNQNVKGVKIGLVFSFEKFFSGEGVSVSDIQDYGVENVTNLCAWDSEGNEITADYNDEIGDVLFAVSPVKIAYDYITGFRDVKMDVTVFNESDIVDLSPSGAGCDLGIILPMFIAIGALMFIKRKT